MNKTADKTRERSESASEKKPGFFGRLFQKLDDSMKKKAEEQSQQGCCCNDGDSKGGKCS